MCIWIMTLIKFQKPSYPVLMGKFPANDDELLMLQKFIYSFLRGRVVCKKPCKFEMICAT